jgi:hypothetical protein
MDSAFSLSDHWVSSESGVKVAHLSSLMGSRSHRWIPALPFEQLHARRVAGTQRVRILTDCRPLLIEFPCGLFVRGAHSFH